MIVLSRPLGGHRKREWFSNVDWSRIVPAAVVRICFKHEGLITECRGPDVETIWSTHAYAWFTVYPGAYLVISVDSEDIILMNPLGELEKFSRADFNEEVVTNEDGTLHDDYGVLLTPFEGEPIVQRELIGSSTPMKMKEVPFDSLFTGSLDDIR